jgi:hypothetical protein
MRERHHMLPVWFFIGILLFIYGIIILITAVREWSRPSDVVLSQYHPALWGGIVLFAIGGFYLIHFWPRGR